MSIISGFNFKDYIIDSFRIGAPTNCDHCTHDVPWTSKWSTGKGVYLKNKENPNYLIFCKYSCYIREFDFGSEHHMIAYEQVLARINASFFRNLHDFNKSYFCRCELMNAGILGVINYVRKDVISDDDFKYYIENRFTFKHDIHDNERIVNINNKIKSLINKHEQATRVVRYSPYATSSGIQHNIHNNTQGISNQMPEQQEENSSQDVCNNLDFLNTPLAGTENLFNIELQNESINNNMK